ncbi:MAG: TetR/AcrR family transcriptional regulator [Legionella sp.]|nr:TetR/AcrR family transcriptional regulator [Legionella sp.]
MKAGITRALALTEARKLVQTFGFNKFSFQHIANILGIKKPSLYNHFATKEQLGTDLIEEYRLSFSNWSETVAIFDPKAQIGALFEIFFKFSCDLKKICPLSALIADYNSFTNNMQTALRALYDVQYSWLVSIIKKGQDQGLFCSNKSSEELAHSILAIGLGSQFIARITNNPEQIHQLKDMALHLLTHNMSTKEVL